MSIEKEIIKSEKYQLKTEKFNNTTLVELTTDNVAKVEAMISTDSSYSRGTDVNAKPKRDYEGSSAYWFNQFNNRNKKLKDFEYLEKIGNDIIFQLVSAIDRENSTHLNAHKKGYNYIDGRTEITQRIAEITKSDFLENLSNPTNSKFYLYQKIASETMAGRKNPSFASKFCHYSCLYLFDKNDKRRDNYSIYDGILREVIPHYARRYKIELCKIYKDAIKEKSIMVYPYYWEIVGNIIEKAYKETGDKISRNGFDHLLWYYHKGRMYKLK